MKSKLEINSDRLLIRPILKNDAEAIFKYRSDSIANIYQSWIPTSIDEVCDFINNKVASKLDVYDTWYQFVIVKKETGKLIGDIGIHFIDVEKYQAEIGCTLDKNQQGKGFATEALIGTINYLFSNLNKYRIIASVDPRNKKSIELVERLGFRKEAHFKKSLLIKGEWVDDVVYAILKDEWTHQAIK